MAAAAASVDRELAKLASNEHKRFSLQDAVANLRRKLTRPQARALANALLRSTSIETFDAYLGVCPLLATGLFIDFVRSSPRLKEVKAHYKSKKTDPEEIQELYTTQLDRLFQAVRDNSSIKTLMAYSVGSPEVIYDVLAHKSSLTRFHFIGDVPETGLLSTQAAFSIAAGLGKSTSLEKVELQETKENLETMLSGLASSSSVKSLTLHLNHDVSPPAASLWEAIAKMLSFSASLEDMHITFAPTRHPMEEGLAKVHSARCHPACTGLKKLRLVDVVITNPATLPRDQVNKSLQLLHLDDVGFKSPGAVRAFWPFVGLQELCITKIHYPPSIDIDDSERGAYIENWALFIRRNDRLAKVNLDLWHNVDIWMLNGVLEGARKHPSLKKLTITNDPDQLIIGRDVGLRLCQVLEESSSSLEELYWREASFEPMCITFLAQGLVQNHSVQVLHFATCKIETDGVKEILESLFVNDTLRDLAFKDLMIPVVIGGVVTMSQTLCQLFRVNTTLVKLGLGAVDFCGGRMSEALVGLRDNTTLKRLVLDECSLDNEAMTSLGQALESPEIPLQEIGLPRDQSRFQVPNVKEGTHAFLQSLVRMPNVKKIHFGDTIRDVDDEFRGLLLVAVKENKNIHVLDGDAPTMDKASAGKAEIEYYLKLNRFGRCLLDSTNVLPGLWPRILSQMTCQQQDNADALFYFIREYFSRQNKHDSSETNQHAQQPPQQRVALVSD